MYPAGETTDPFFTLTGLDSTSLTWNVNLGVGTTGYLELKDSTGESNVSADFTVMNGS